MATRTDCGLFDFLAMIDWDAFVKEGLDNWYFDNYQEGTSMHAHRLWKEIVIEARDLSRPYRENVR